MISFYNKSTQFSECILPIWPPCQHERRRKVERPFHSPGDAILKLRSRRIMALLLCSFPVPYLFLTTINARVRSPPKAKAHHRYRLCHRLQICPIRILRNLLIFGIVLISIYFYMQFSTMLFLASPAVFPWAFFECG